MSLPDRQSNPEVEPDTAEDLVSDHGLLEIPTTPMGHANDFLDPDDAPTKFEVQAFDQPPAPEDRIGTVVDGFKLMAILGDGSVGQVYEAEHVRLGRRAAFKFLKSEHRDNSILVKRFFGEARAVNQIAHDNIVDISDFVEQIGGECYVRMELLRGQTLEALLQDNRISWSRTIEIGRQIASALAASHAAGVIHRDLKPANIFLRSDAAFPDFVKLIDFGAARLREVADHPDLHRTRAGAILGTPAYMSPEQTRGDPIDGRADIYSLGVVLYECLTGTVPFTASTIVETLKNQQSLQADPVSSLLPDGQVPEALDRLVMDCLQKDPKDRPQSAMLVLRRLQNINRRRNASIAPPTASKPKNRLLLWWLAAVVAGFAVGGLLIQAFG